MYTNLRTILRNRSMSLKNFGTLLDITEKTAQNKIFEATDFTLTEARKAMMIFPEYTMDYLFYSDGNKGSAAIEEPEATETQPSA